MVTDFIGDPIVVGGYVARSGTGNTSAEYSMILYKVLEIKEKTDKIKVRRLVGGPHVGFYCYSVVWIETSKCVVVFPSPEVVKAFEDILNSLGNEPTARNSDPKMLKKIGNWLHSGAKWW